MRKSAATEFCTKYGLKLPILLAPMAGACPASLSIAVANAGGMGAMGALMTSAPGDGNPIGGVKVVAKDGWFAARPSGTEDIYKIYAESFKGEGHLKRIQEEAQVIVGRALGAA